MTVLIARLRDPEFEPGRFDLRQELTFAIAALIEVFWAIPWFAAMMPGLTDPPFGGLLLYVGGNILLALALVRVLDTLGIRVVVRQALYVAGVAASFALTLSVFFPGLSTLQAPEHTVDAGTFIIQILALPPAVAFLIAIGLMWWRGLRLALVTPSATRIAFSVRWGVLMFLGAGLLFYETAGDLIKICLPLFFFFGLLGISLSRAESFLVVWKQPVSFGWRWAVFMGLAAAAIVLLGMAVALFITSLPPEQIADVVRFLLAIPVALCLLVLAPLFLLLEPVFTAIARMVDDILSQRLNPVPNEGNNELFQQPQQPNPLQGLFDQLHQVFDALGGIQTCMIIIVVLVILSVVIFAIRRGQRAEVRFGEDREDLDIDEGGLGGLLRRGLNALGDVFGALGQFGLGRGLMAALTIRRIYARMGRLAGQRGYPRALAETPYEYRVTLQAAFPDLEPQVSLVTEAYVQVRYGELPETDADYQAVLDAWNTLKASPAKKQS